VCNSVDDVCNRDNVCNSVDTNIDASEHLMQAEEVVDVTNGKLEEDPSLQSQESSELLYSMIGTDDTSLLCEKSCWRFCSE